MKQLLLTFIAILAIAFTIDCQPTLNTGFGYQSVIRDADGKALPNYKTYLRFSVFSTERADTLVYQETQAPFTDDYGWLSINVGDGDVLVGEIDDIDWSSSLYYLTIECSEDEGEIYNEIGSTPINSAPYIGPQGEQGIMGAVGEVGERGEQGAQGIQGIQGPEGPKGDNGQDGTGVNIVGSIPTANDLEPDYTGEVGDMYITEDNGIGYVWDGVVWINVGQIQGPTGPQGTTGPQGIQGEQGIEGPIGLTGPQGDEGLQGPIGPTGADGMDGNEGLQGPIGLTGADGVDGADGIDGTNGTNGVDGTDGVDGVNGADGVDGTDGVDGVNGADGMDGADGADGANGADGMDGAQGPIGPAGTYTAGNGIAISSDIITNTGDTNAGDDLTLGTDFLGDVEGSYNTLKVTKLQGYEVSDNIPNSGEALVYDGLEWKSADVGSAIYGGGDLFGPVSSTQVRGIHGYPIYTAPATGEMLVFDGVGWDGIQAGIGLWSQNNPNEIEFTGSSGDAIINTSSKTFKLGNIWTQYDNNNFTVSNSGTVIVEASDNFFRPGGNNTKSLGTSWAKWTEVWATNGMIQTSDARFKKNIIPLSNSLSVISKLNPVTYKWKDNNRDQSAHIGFLAQELETVLPEVVVKGQDQEGEDTYGVKYAEIIPVLVKAVQELSEQNAALLKRIEDLEQK